MLSSESVEKIKQLADEVSRREGCRLYDIEFASHPKNRILRVFIEADADTVSIDQCANVSRGLSLLLDVEDLIPGGRYELEVSSPGVERQLRVPWHYAKAIGKDVKIISNDPIEGMKGAAKSVAGTLVASDEMSATVFDGAMEVKIPFTNIKKAQMVFTIKKNEKKR